MKSVGRMWDPIGLGETDGWLEDEYDSYLLQAAGRLWNGASQEEVANYFVSIETECMGLGEDRRSPTGK